METRFDVRGACITADPDSGRLISEAERLELLRAKTVELIQAAATVGASADDVKEALETALAATPLG